MILFSASQPIVAFKQTFFELYNSSVKSFDPKHWKEDTATIEILVNQSEYINPIFINNETIEYTFDYKKYFPSVKEKVISDEIEYYSQKFFTNNTINTIIEHLQKDKFSKRAVLNFWKPEFLNPETTSVCISSCYFRIKDNFLELHSHSRANNLFFLTLIDVQMMIGFQYYVAKHLGLNVGTYLHFFDSIHFFTRDIDFIEEQYNFMQTNTVWKF